MILVDSSVWIDFFNRSNTPETNLLDSLLGTEPLLIGDLILVEALQGFRSDLELARASQVLAAFEMHELCGRRVAFQTISNYRTLRARGVTIRKTIDVVIGTWCILNGHQLLHCDRDFAPMERYLGMRVFRG